MSAEVQLRRLAQINPLTPEFATAEGEVTFVPLECVWPRGQADFTRRAEAEDVASSYTRFRAGDVLLPKVTPTFQAGRSTVATIETSLGAASTEVHILRETERSSARYLAYLGQSRPFISEGETVVEGVGNLLRVPTEWLKAFSVPLLTRRQQESIADFLDRETVQIDAMIEAQMDVVRLAHEHRASVVAEGVAGLGADGAPVVALRHCLQVQAGVTLGRHYGDEATDYPYLRVANVQAGYLNLEQVKTVRVPSEVAAASTLQSGDVLITEGGDRAALGRGALWRGEIVGALHQNHIFALRCGPLLDPEFLVYVLDAPDARIYFESTRRQTTNLSSTNSSKVKAFKTPLPPISEQRILVERLNRVLSRVDDVIGSGQEVIDLLRERREALITAAVTGGIEPATGVERINSTTYREAS